MLRRTIPSILLLLLLYFSSSALFAQDTGADLPYREILTHPESYAAGTVAAKVIDGLGFRYYWATEGLGREDLDFQPSAGARSSGETLDHIHDLSQLIVNSTRKVPNDRSNKPPKMSFEEKRKATLLNLQEASNTLKNCSSQELGEFKVIFKRGDNIVEYPFWNQLNGPIADALWHTGQIVSFRRSSGNPINPKVNFLTGGLRE